MIAEIIFTFNVVILLLFCITFAFLIASLYNTNTKNFAPLKYDFGTVKSIPTALTNIQHSARTDVILVSRTQFLIKISIQNLMLSLNSSLFGSDCQAVAL